MLQSGHDFQGKGQMTLKDIGQGQRSLYATHPHILVIICAIYGKNRSRTVDFFFKVKAEKIAKNSNFQILKKTQHATHSLIIVIICAKYKKNPLRTVDATERTRFSKSRPNDLEDIGQGSSHATPSHASDHLYQIWKEYIKNCRCYRADTIFKAKAKWPWRYRSRSKVIICNTPSHTSDHLCYMWKESIENCRFFFSRSRPKNLKKLPKIQIFRFWKKTPHTL